MKSKTNLTLSLSATGRYSPAFQYRYDFTAKGQQDARLGRRKIPLEDLHAWNNASPEEP
jgi:hypothetical protein